MYYKALQEALNRFRVRAGLVLAVAVIVLARPTWPSIFIGILICVLGLAIRAWASGHLRKEKELTVSGPYRFSRNPLYLGNFLLGTGITAGARSWWVAGLFIAYFAVFYPLIIRRERERMQSLFPGKYEDYGKRVPLFFPNLKKSLRAEGRFSWPQYRQNKEYRALYGTVIVWLVLAAKMLLLKG